MKKDPNKKIFLTGEDLDIATLVSIAKDYEAYTICLCEKSKKRVQEYRKYVETILNGNETIYGVNTGFGLLSNTKISNEKLCELQLNLIRSHASGVGNPLSKVIVRAALVLRANTLAKGYSGCRVELIEAILNLINNDITPYVPEQGSVGACGDLAPLAHMGLVLVGEGQAYYNNVLMDGGTALQKANLKPITLQAKEGISLVNGTQVMTAIGAIVVHEARKLMKLSDIAAATSLEAYKGTNTAFHPLIHELRPHPMQLVVAKNILNLTAESKIRLSHKKCDKVQDPYSFRCVPQVHGASRKYIEQAKSTIEIEMNSCTDNPLVFLPSDIKKEGKHKDGGEIISCGNFHGQYIAICMDTVSIALSEMANISDQRIQKLINPDISGLPAFLTPNPGLNSGLMLTQVTAAAIVSENKVLSHPSSVDSIPTSADKEDHVSMGLHASRKAATILSNVQKVIAIELLCGVSGLEFLKPLTPGIGVQRAYEFIRKTVKPIGMDRPFYKDIEVILSSIKDSSLLDYVEEVNNLH